MLIVKPIVQGHTICVCVCIHIMFKACTCTHAYKMIKDTLKQIARIFLLKFIYIYVCWYKLHMCLYVWVNNY